MVKTNPFDAIFSKANKRTKGCPSEMVAKLRKGLSLELLEGLS